VSHPAFLGLIGHWVVSNVWLMVGLLGQGFFASRFLVQWVVSERKGESVIPVVFWDLSIFGGAVLLAYAIYRQDPVFILGQGAGLVVYVRNLMLIRRKQRLAKEADAPA
jgi:lipid-A-disaccharide synthase-like uncharacterized protein